MDTSGVGGIAFMVILFRRDHLQTSQNNPVDLLT
jgi:hypothetical protein